MSINLSCEMITSALTIPFTVLSMDFFICPFDLGFITIRTQVNHEQLDLTTALEFSSRFRDLQDVNIQDDATFITSGEERYIEVEDFIFKRLASCAIPYLDKSEAQGAYFETLPFFVDEKMYVQSFLCFYEECEIDEYDQFRAVQIDGVNEHGYARISTNNRQFMLDYLEKHRYTRWLPNTIYLTNENCFCCLTNTSVSRSRKLADEMYGEFYYGLLLNLFHKIVLLKLSNRYSIIQLEQDQEEIEDLIRSITKFSANYFFLELVSQSQGKEIFIMLRRVFDNNELYDDVKYTLMDLYKYQDRHSSKRSNNLLMILTLYTVIGGIFGMNAVIEDLKGSIDWGNMMDYTVFEFVALFLTFTGIPVGIILAVTVTSRWVKDRLNNRA